MSDENVTKRMYSFGHFLNEILASKELIYSPELVQFLSEKKFDSSKKVIFF